MLETTNGGVDNFQPPDDQERNQLGDPNIRTANTDNVEAIASAKYELE